MSAEVNGLRVGMIGLGNMGGPMAARLIQAGYSLVLYDVRPAAAALINQGAAWAESPAAVARGANLILTSLPGPEQAEAVFFGEAGILSAARPRMLLIDLTTNCASLVRRMHDALVERAAAMLDVPVSGGVEAAARGELTLLVGGQEEHLTRCRPVLERLATSILHVGPIGTASMAKALHNCAVFCSNLATVECLTAGVKAGVDAAMLVKIFQQSGLGRNLDLQVAMPATLFQGRFQPPRFAMKTAHKDMLLALDLAGKHGVPMQMAEVCARDMQEAVRRGWGDLDNTVFLSLQEERADVKVRLKDQTP